MAVFRRSGRVVARLLTAAMVLVGLAAVMPVFNSPTSAQSCPRRDQ